MDGWMDGKTACVGHFVMLLPGIAFCARNFGLRKRGLERRSILTPEERG